MVLKPPFAIVGEQKAKCQDGSVAIVTTQYFFGDISELENAEPDAPPHHLNLQQFG